MTLDKSPNLSEPHTDHPRGGVRMAPGPSPDRAFQRLGSLSHALIHLGPGLGLVGAGAGLRLGLFWDCNLIWDWVEGDLLPTQS